MLDMGGRLVVTIDWRSVTVQAKNGYAGRGDGGCEEALVTISLGVFFCLVMK
jgi:hypothetical protein